MSRKSVTVLFITMLVATGPLYSPAVAADYSLPDGSKLNLHSNCPVCGMMVGGQLASSATYAYSHGKLTGFAGIAAVVFEDGTVVGFDSARCLFIYNKIPKKYGVDVGKIGRRFVTDFDSKKFINTNGAYLVMGTKILGFMGYDLIPFSSEERALAFMKEHGGKKVVQLQTVSAEEVERRN